MKTDITLLVQKILFCVFTSLTMFATLPASAASKKDVKTQEHQQPKQEANERPSQSTQTNTDDSPTRVRLNDFYQDLVLPREH